MRYGLTGVASWSHPLVTLAVYPTGVELHSTFSWLRFLVPVWRARYDELAVVQSVGRGDPDRSDSAKAPAQARGVRFVAKDGSWVMFWCYNRDEVLAAFDRQQVRIDAEPRRFQFLHPEA